MTKRKMIMELWNDMREPGIDVEKIRAQINSLTATSNPKATDIHVDCGGKWFSVYVRDDAAKFGAWVDVTVDEDMQDVGADWNQYIFNLHDENDVYQKLHQENCGVFDDFTSEAISALERHGYIYQDNNGNWHNNFSK